ncbi:MAG: NUDIX hydrolase [Thermoanaerobaculia bacterium]
MNSRPLPVPSASVIVLRGEPFEVLLMLRHASSSFVPGVWVFPGGVVETCDRAMTETDLDAMKACAMRELFEETGIWIGAAMENAAEVRRARLARECAFDDVAAAPLPLERLTWTSRWITPIGIPKRFDTYFFLSEVPIGTEAIADQTEGVEMRWLRPEAALAAHRDRQLPLVLPTIKNLEALTGFTTAAELIASRRGAVISPVQPVLVGEGGRRRPVLPEDV